jgi:hypothetical protein
MGAPTSSYATAGIALRVSGALKPHHHDKVETPSVRLLNNYSNFCYDICKRTVTTMCKIGFEVLTAVTMKGEVFVGCGVIH